MVSDHQKFILGTIQPLILGLCDGSISTLAPLYTVAFLSNDPMLVFWTVTAASIGAAISMAASEGLSDDGKITGRGHPIRRGLITGLGTFVGGFLHTIPFLIPNMLTAIVIASIIVGIELFVIALIRWRYLNTTLINSILNVTVIGFIVAMVGLLTGGIH